ncbi:hypothetical protein FWK35_00008645 [Aphis craccivora]|uniref:Uncharacterized protein n=1 Tax=Aphis craccivora TaxID=307492 RepID=A0A6G0Z054_APHCR|nr:hypothetical protein FWK35_00008645 [Aphis craccivora]
MICVIDANRFLNSLTLHS